MSLRLTAPPGTVTSKSLRNRVIASMIANTGSFIALEDELSSGVSALPVPLSVVHF